MKYLFIILTIIHSTMGAGELKRRSLGHPDNNAQLVNPDGKVEIPVLYDDQSVNLEFDLTGIENGVSGLLYDKDNDQFVAIRNNFTATAAPAVGNDATQGYRPGSKWYDTNSDNFYECIDNSEGAAVWKDSSGGLDVDDSPAITGNWTFNAGAVFGNQLYLGTLVGQGIVRTITPSAPIIYGLNNTVISGLAKHHFKGQSTNTYLAVFDGDVSFLGDVIVSGSTFQVDSEISTADTVIAINDGEVGAGVTLGYAGTYIDRGSANPYFFGYDEVRDGFVVGEITELSTAQIATAQMIATREDNPTDGGIAVWTDSEKRFDTALTELLFGNLDDGIIINLSGKNGNTYTQSIDNTGIDGKLSIQSTRSGSFPVQIDSFGKLFLPGNSDNTTASSSNLYIDPANGRLYRVASSSRYKTNIKKLEVSLDTFLSIKPVHFTDKESKKNHIGFIAENLDEIGLTELVEYLDDIPESVRYSNMTAVNTLILQKILQNNNLQL